MKKQRINSELTWFFTRLLPLSWYVLCVLVLYSTMRNYNGDSLTLLLAAIPLVGAVAVFFVVQNHFNPMLDEVYDEGNFLRVIQGNQEHRLSLNDIKLVKYHEIFNLKVVELQLKAGHTPAVLKFLPRTLGFSNKPVGEVFELLDRINN